MFKLMKLIKGIILFNIVFATVMYLLFVVSEINEARNEFASATETIVDESTGEVLKVKTNSKVNMKVHFIDVGQADATLIEVKEGKAQYNVLIDAGNWDRIDVIDYLNEKKIKKLDLVIGTHPHADHIGQLDKVIKNFDVEEVWMSGDTNDSQAYINALEAIDKYQVTYNEPREGDVYKIGPLKIDVLNPIDVDGNLNNGSIVTKLTLRDVRFLFMGDAEKEVEDRLIQEYDDLKVDVLKVGHHGSRTSTTEAFLNEVNPDIAVISSGTSNEYDHPHDEIVDRIQGSGINLYLTNFNETTVIATDGTKLAVKTDYE